MPSVALLTVLGQRARMTGSKQFCLAPPRYFNASERNTANELLKRLDIKAVNNNVEMLVAAREILGRSNGRQPPQKIVDWFIDTALVLELQMKNHNVGGINEAYNELEIQLDRYEPREVLRAELLNGNIAHVGKRERTAQYEPPKNGVSHRSRLVPVDSNHRFHNGNGISPKTRKLIERAKKRNYKTDSLPEERIDLRAEQTLVQYGVQPKAAGLTIGNYYRVYYLTEPNHILGEGELIGWKEADQGIIFNQHDLIDSQRNIKAVIHEYETPLIFEKTDPPKIDLAVFSALIPENKTLSGAFALYNGSVTIFGRNRKIYGNSSLYGGDTVSVLDQSTGEVIYNRATFKSFRNNVCTFGLGLKNTYHAVNKGGLAVIKIKDSLTTKNQIENIGDSISLDEKYTDKEPKLQIDQMYLVRLGALWFVDTYKGFYFSRRNGELREALCFSGGHVLDIKPRKYKVYATPVRLKG